MTDPLYRNERLHNVRYCYPTRISNRVVWWVFSGFLVLAGVGGYVGWEWMLTRYTNANQ